MRRVGRPKSKVVWGGALVSPAFHTLFPPLFTPAQFMLSLRCFQAPLESLRIRGPLFAYFMGLSRGQVGI